MNGFSAPKRSAGGHWFCEHCDDVVHGIGSPDSPPRCPYGSHHTVVWIARSRRVSDETARRWFQQMRDELSHAPAQTQH